MGSLLKSEPRLMMNHSSRGSIWGLHQTVAFDRFTLSIISLTGVFSYPDAVSCAGGSELSIREPGKMQFPPIVRRHP